MRLGVLFSGGKDSMYSAFLAKKRGYKLSCLISIFSKNKDSFMFHTPAIELTKKQSNLMGLPLIVFETLGKKELELQDLERAIVSAIKKYKIRGVVTGAVGSVYQASRIQNICNKLGLECFNPLWQKNQIELLEELLKNKFQVILSGVAAYPLDKKWVGRKIDKFFIEEMKKLHEKYKINPAGEGGEFESLVIDCPLFKNKLDFKIKNIIGEGNAWRAEFE
ncbi:diphthine--ammonia ligase [Candidatus Pacearchaeota archaeon]|nr:diphthine--ammonia ligase [Candidatus Pacearchaeota archaeon]